MSERISLDSICEKKITTLPSYYEGKIDYVDISSVDNISKQIINTQSLSAKEAPSRAKQLLMIGDILVSTVRPNLNAVAMVKEDADNLLVGSTGYCVLRCKENIDKRYVFHFCQSPYFVDDMTTQATGASYPAVSSGIVKSSTIPLLPIEKQSAIADILDKVSSLLSLRKQQLAKLDELVKARFVELFGDPEHNEKKWDVFKLDALCSVSSSKRIYQNELSVEGVPFLRISDLVNRIDTGSTECELYIPEERYEELKTLGLVPIAGDMLITARGTLGRCYTLTENDRFYFQDGMITWLYDFDKSLTTNYLTHLFEMSGFRKQIDSLQAGSTVAYLSISMTKKLNVMLPPLELQNQFTAFVEQTDKSKLAIQQSLDKLETLKKSLMQKYFG